METENWLQGGVKFAHRDERLGSLSVRHTRSWWLSVVLCCKSSVVVLFCTLLLLLLLKRLQIFLVLQQLGVLMKMSQIMSNILDNAVSPSAVWFWRHRSSASVLA